MEIDQGSQDPGVGSGSQDPGEAGVNPGAGEGTPQAINITADVLGEYRDDPAFKSFEGKPIGEVLKSFKSAQQMIGGEKIVIPQGALDTDEVWGQVFDKLGRPKDPSGYQFDKPELPEGLVYDDHLEKAWSGEAHKLGLLPKQAAGIYSFYNGMMIEAVKAMNAEQAQAQAAMETALIGELGNREKYDEFLRLGATVLNMAGLPDAERDAIAGRYKNDLVLMKALGNIGRKMTEASLIKGDRGGAGAVDGKKDLDGILYDKANPLHKAYFDKQDPRHQEAVDRVLEIRNSMGGNTPINMAG